MTNLIKVSVVVSVLVVAGLFLLPCSAYAAKDKDGPDNPISSNTVTKAFDLDDTGETISSNVALAAFRKQLESKDDADVISLAASDVMTLDETGMKELYDIIRNPGRKLITIGVRGTNEEIKVTSLGILKKFKAAELDIADFEGTSFMFTKLLKAQINVLSELFKLKEGNILECTLSNITDADTRKSIRASSIKG